MGYALKNEESYTEMMCGDCGMVFYVPETWRLDHQTSGKGFYCPNGHSRIYKETIEAKLRKELETKERQLQWERNRAESLTKKVVREEGKRKRLERRIHAGVCPHCQRTFKQLAEHMKSKHREAIKVSEA